MTRIDLLLHQGIDIKNGVVDLTGPVDYAMYERVYMASTIFQDHPQEKLTYMLSTEGGDFYMALAIYDWIKFTSESIPTKIVCNGLVCSAGPLILQAADERVAMPNCQFLVHYGEDLNDSTTTAKHNHNMTKLMRDILVKRSKVTSATAMNWLSKESWFSPDRALKVGLIDRIIGGEDGPS